MGNVLVAASAAVLVACSAAAPTTAPDAGANASAEDTAAAPVITYALGPEAVAQGTDGCYALVIVLSYRDDDEEVVSFELATADGTIAGPLPPISDGFTSADAKLARGTDEGRLAYELRVVSASGRRSSPFADVVLLR